MKNKDIRVCALEHEKIIGVADDSTAINFMRPSDFSDDKFEGIGLYQRRDKKPVVLFRSKSMHPQHWQIIDGVMDFHFLSYEEAAHFCKIRGYTLVKGEKHDDQ